ncbi:LAFA_0E03554g1_1 [Lachancea sp. 'fantastica']|nr:LAFA_0E03554g1_1 [Lachancea sp. 'fantastica']
MEQLNSLEKSLPPEGPVNDQNIDKLNRQVTQEFKIAANAVTSLYRLSSERSSLSRHMGYVECLGDVLELLDQGVSTHELAKWCEDRKQEKSGHNSGPVDDSRRFSKGSENTHCDSAAAAMMTSPTFRLSKPVMSVERAPRRCVKPELTERFLQQQQQRDKPDRRSKKKRTK